MSTRSRRSEGAPWVRTRLRTAPLASVLAAVLAFAAVFLATGWPRALDRAGDQAVHALLRRADPTSTQVQVLGPGGVMDPSTGNVPSSDESVADLGFLFGQLRQGFGPDLPLDARSSSYGARSRRARDLSDLGLARPGGQPPKLDLLYLAQTTDHLRLVGGHWPDTAPNHGIIPIALARSTATTLGVRLGQVLHTGNLAAADGRPSEVDVAGVQITGLYTADNPAERYWAGLPCVTHACLKSTRNDVESPKYWLATAIVGPRSLGYLAPWGVTVGFEDFWSLAVSIDQLHSDRLADSRTALNSLLGGPALAATGRDDLVVNSGLGDLLDQAVARQAAVRPLTAVAAAGLAGVVTVVLCLAAGLTAERRAEEWYLLRSRGGSRRDLVVRLLGEGAATVLPACGLATVLALTLLPTPRWGTAVLDALAVSLLAVSAVPVLATVRDALRVRPRRPRRGRRAVAELALVAAAAAAVLEVRRRGIGQVDPLLVASPLLLAAVGALVLARLQPPVVGALARAARRGSGAVGFLGLARAANPTGARRRASVLPLLALTLAVTTAGFGATTLRSVDDHRTGAARSVVGGDASVVAPSETALAPPVVRALAALPGLHLGTSFWEQDDVSVEGRTGGPLVTTVLAVDPASYARLARSVGRGTFDPALLTAGSSGTRGTVPALVSRDLAGVTAGGRPLGLAFGDNVELRITNAAVVAGTPALVEPAGTFVVVPIGPAAALAPETGQANRWLGLGDVTVTQLRALAPASYLVDTASAHAASLADDPLQTSAIRMFWLATIATWCFAVLAVLLQLVRAGPDRAALLARLRTMGLRPRQGLRLILAEALPQSLTAAVGGGLTAAAAVLLLGPTIDLSPLVGAGVPPGLTLGAPPILEQTLIVAGLATLAVVVEAAVQGRRQITIELRAGDGR